MHIKTIKLIYQILLLLYFLLFLWLYNNANALSCARTHKPLFEFINSAVTIQSIEVKEIIIKKPICLEWNKSNNCDYEYNLPVTYKYIVNKYLKWTWDFWSFTKDILVFRWINQWSYHQKTWSYLLIDHQFEKWICDNIILYSFEEWETLIKNDYWLGSLYIFWIIDIIIWMTNISRYFVSVVLLLILWFRNYKNNKSYWSYIISILFTWIFFLIIHTISRIILRFV